MSERNHAARLLLIIDDPAHRRIHDSHLTRAGYRVRASGDFPAAQVLLRSFEPDIVIMGTQRDTKQTVEDIRSQRDCLVIVLQSSPHPAERVALLRAGVDDVVSTTIDHDELSARCDAMLRRVDSSSDDTESVEPLTAGPLEIDKMRHEVRLNRQVVPATRIEFSLLEQLVRNSGQVISREELLQGVWGPHWVGDPHVVDVHLSNLRRKLAVAMPDLRVIKTVRGIGFRLSDEVLQMDQDSLEESIAS